MFECYECCVFSGRVLCDRLIIRPEDYYRLLCVVVFNLETSKFRRRWAVPPQEKFLPSTVQILINGAKY